jgi:hypothetical protein
MKQLIIALLLIVSANAFAANERRIASGSWMGCVSKEAYEKLVHFAVQKDEEAFARMILGGQCIPLKSGATVYLEDVSLFSGVTGIRLKGSTQTLWTAIEAVK